MKNLLSFATAAVVALWSSSSANAAFIPTGVMNDVSMATVENTWGWTVTYMGTYADTVSIATLFANTGDNVMLAAAAHGSTTFDILAAGLKTDVQTHTNENTTHTANGVAFYYNGDAMGFTAPGNSINQTPTDDLSVNPRTRLSWATSLNSTKQNEVGVEGSSSPLYVIPGGRSGTNTLLNDTSFDRYVLTLNTSSDAIATPAPAGLLVALVGFGCLLGYRRVPRTKAPATA